MEKVRAIVKFTDAILEFGRQDCTRSHDKIYGLLGLSNVPIEVDYNMPRMELYQRSLLVGILELLTDIDVEAA